MCPRQGGGVKRRERTKMLIEVGGLVVKAGLVDLTDDDRATIYGALLAIAGKLQGEERNHTLALWKRRGKHAFEAESAADRLTSRSIWQRTE